MSNGYFAAASLWNGLSNQAFRQFAHDEAERGREDGANAVARSPDGYVQAITLRPKGSWYGEAYNEAATISYVAAVRNMAREQFRLEAVKNQFDPQKFDAFARGYMDRQLSETPQELQGPLKLDLATTLGEFKATILSNVERRDREAQNAQIEYDVINQADDLYGYAQAGDTRRMTEKRLEAEQGIKALEANGEFRKALALRQVIDRNLKEGPLMGRAIRLYDAREAQVATEGELGGFFNLVRGAESSGKYDAKNPNSSAYGAYQFLDGTWINTVKKHFGQEVADKTDAQILAMRGDKRTQDVVMQRFTEDNHRAMKAAGVVGIGEPELYLAHFLGAGNAIELLKGDPNRAVSDIVSPKVMQANKFLAGMSAKDLYDWSKGKMAGSIQAQIKAGKFGRGVDTANAFAADLQANPSQYGLDMNDASRMSGLIRQYAATRQAALASTINNAKAEERFAYGQAIMDVERKLDDPWANGYASPDGPEVLRREAEKIALKYGENPANISHGFLNKLASKLGENDDLLKRAQEIAEMRWNGGAVPNDAGTRKVVDYVTKSRNQGVALSIFNPDHAKEIVRSYREFGLFPTVVQGQLENLHNLVGNPAAGVALANTIGVMDALAAGKDTMAFTEDMRGMIGSRAMAHLDRLLAAAGDRGSIDPEHLVKTNERIASFANPRQDTRMQALQVLGETPDKQIEAFDKLVAERTSPGALGTAMSKMVDWGAWLLDISPLHHAIMGSGPQDLMNWLGGQFDPRTQKQIREIALEELGNGWNSPEKAVEVAVGRVMKNGAYTTWGRGLDKATGQREDMTPRFRANAPERWYDGQVFADETQRAAFNFMKEHQLKQSDFGREVGQFIAIAEEILQSGVTLDGERFKALLNSKPPPATREITERDVRVMMESGLLDVEQMRPPKGNQPPTWRITVNRGGRWVPMIDDFQPDPAVVAQRQRQAGEEVVGWMRRFKEGTGVPLPAVIGKMGVGMKDRVEREMQKWVQDRPGARFERFDEGLSTGFDDIRSRTRNENNPFHVPESARDPRPWTGNPEDEAPRDPRPWMR